MPISNTALVSRVRDAAIPLTGGPDDYDPLMDRIGDASIVLLGEATHGTHEFYESRMRITQRLIEEMDFTAVALEADWPDCVQINRHIHRSSNQSETQEALSAFKRFPVWMWRNTDVSEFVDWLANHNRRESISRQVGVYGLDLYSLDSSIQEVVLYWDNVDSEAARSARTLYSCFDHTLQDPIQYGRQVHIGTRPSCELQAFQALNMFLQRRSSLRQDPDGGVTSLDEELYARQNAEVVKNAESYYRNLFNPTVNAWNVRDRHMADTVDTLLEHLKEQGRPPKVVIWAHNSHVGDDRATEMGKHGQWNIGQLLRQRHPGSTFTLGFTTYEGTVQAADEWGLPPRLKTIRPALETSVEHLCHQTAIPRFFLDLRSDRVFGELEEPRLERAIGVIYSPETERASHYFHASVSRQFDAIIHIDASSGVTPLASDGAESPE